MDMLGGLTVFLVVICILLMAYAPIYQLNQDQFAIRIRRRSKTTHASLINAPRRSIIISLLKLAGERILMTFPDLADSRTRELLMHADRRSSEHLAAFIGIKSSCLAGTTLLVGFGEMDLPLKIMVMLAGAYVSWTVPNYFLAGAAQRRKEKIVSELPVALDLLIVCAQAGTGLLVCIDKVQKETIETCPNLSKEFQQMIQDIKIFGKSSGMALREMGERCGVEDIVNMASALISAESKGSDISYPLKQQSSALRDKLKRKREEEAAKIPVKMVPVIMIFVMPAILCPLLGPAVITILSTLPPVISNMK